MDAFHESRQIDLQHTERREVWCLAAAQPLPNTNSPPLLEAIANQNEIHPNRWTSSQWIKKINKGISMKIIGERIGQ